MKILGIDPGKFGYWCLLDTDSGQGIARQLRWSADGILIWKEIPKADRIVMEKVHAIPGMMNARSAFSFGYSVGQLHAFTSNQSVSLVTPQVWQKICLEGVETTLDTKERSKAAFARINPETRDFKLNHNMTDAFHLANYGILKLGKLMGEWQWLNKDEIWKPSRR
jgi:hypothetical protein